jgi:hypothetical protein
MNKIGQLLLAAFGPVNSYLLLCSDSEKRFWEAPPKGASPWKAAAKHPKGRWYLAKAFLARTIAPRGVVLLVLFYALLGILNSKH